MRVAMGYLFLVNALVILVFAEGVLEIFYDVSDRTSAQALSWIPCGSRVDARSARVTGAGAAVRATARRHCLFLGEEGRPREEHSARHQESRFSSRVSRTKGREPEVEHSQNSAEDGGLRVSPTGIIHSQTCWYFLLPLTLSSLFYASVTSNTVMDSLSQPSWRSFLSGRQASFVG